MVNNNDNQIFECESHLGRFIVEEGQDGKFRIFKMLPPHGLYNKSGDWKRSYVDVKDSRESAVFCAREHADMSLAVDHFIANEIGLSVEEE